MFSDDFVNEIRKTEPYREMEKRREDCDEQKKKVIIGMDFHNNEQTDNKDDEKQIDDVKYNLFLFFVISNLTMSM